MVDEIAIDSSYIHYKHKYQKYFKPLKSTLRIEILKSDINRDIGLCE